MARVWIPSLMRDLTKGQEVVDVPGDTVRAVIASLEVAYPGIKERVCEDEQIAPAITVYVDGKSALLGMLEPVGEQSEMRFLPTMSGG